MTAQKDDVDVAKRIRDPFPLAMIERQANVVAVNRGLVGEFQCHLAGPDQGLAIGNPDSSPRIFETAPRPVPTVDDSLFQSFGLSEAAKPASRDFWERRHLRQGHHPPSSVELMQAEIEASTVLATPLNPDKPFAHLGEIAQPTLVVNGVNDVMIATISSWHMVQNIPNAEFIVYPDAWHGA